MRSAIIEEHRVSAAKKALVSSIALAVAGATIYTSVQFYQQIFSGSNLNLNLDRFKWITALPSGIKSANYQLVPPPILPRTEKLAHAVTIVPRRVS